MITGWGWPVLDYVHRRQDKSPLGLVRVWLEGRRKPEEEQVEPEWVPRTGWNIVRTLERQEKATAIHLCDIQAIIQQTLAECPLEYLRISKDSAWVGQPVSPQKPTEPNPVWVVLKESLCRTAQGMRSPQQRTWHHLPPLCSGSVTQMTMTSTPDSWMLDYLDPPWLIVSIPLPLKINSTFLDPGKDGSFLEMAQQN